MTFVNLIMLVGLAGAGLPLVLHLLSRARYRTLDWGAMMFLVGTDRRQRRSRRLRQWLLLGLRMLLIALLALALARPRFSRPLPGNLSSSAVAAVLILDRSASMGVKEGDQTRMDVAKTAALQILKRLQRGDEVTLLTTGDASPAANPTGDLPALARQVADTEMAAGAADMAAALERAADLLGASQAGNREIYIVSDRQKSSWDSVDAAWTQAWKKREQASGVKTRLFFVPVGGLETDNISVESLELANRPVVENQPVAVEVRLRNDGSSPAPEVALRVKEDRRVLLNTTVSLAARGQAVVRAQALFARAGSHVITASIESPGHAQDVDDSRELALQVEPPIPALIISGDERLASFQRESDFLRLALAPWKTSGKAGSDPFEVLVAGSDRWPPLEVKRFSVVVLANVAQLSEAQAHELEQYVYSGGGLLIAAGGLLQPESYNRLLYRNGAGILPAELSPTPAQTQPRARPPQRIAAMDLSHPSLWFLRQKPDPIPPAVVNRCLPLRRVRSDAHPLLTLADGAPLLLECRAGRGRVLLLTSTLDTEWNSLPLTDFYLPWVQSMVCYLVAGNDPELNLLMGEPLVLSVCDPAGEAQGTVTLPDGLKQPAEVVDAPAGAEIRYTATAEPGRYTLLLHPGTTSGEERRWVFVVSAPPQEADLTPLSPQRLQQLQRDLGFAELDAGSPAFADVVGKQRQGRELWLPLLLGAIAVGIVEMLVAQRWAERGGDRKQKSTRA